MKRTCELRRREFFTAAGAALGVPYLVPSGVLAAQGKPGASQRLTVASIGVGGMGLGHLGQLLKFQELGMTNVAAVCDVDDVRLANAVKEAGPGGPPPSITPPRAPGG